MGYKTGSEIFANQSDLVTAVYIWENESLSSSEITDQVSTNSTDQ